MAVFCHVLERGQGPVMRRLAPATCALAGLASGPGLGHHEAMVETLAFDALSQRIMDLAPHPRRKAIAVVGAPGSGKSTFGAALARHLSEAGEAADLVPMDGFHLDNRLLDADGTRAEKGAPGTFDVGGVASSVARFQDDAPVVHPLFDRTRDLAVAGAGRIARDSRTVVIEGNYLLFDAPIWRDLRAHWGLSVFLDVPRDILLARLIARWEAHGMAPDAARARAEGNDLRNVDLVLSHLLAPDVRVDGTAPLPG